MSVGLVPLKHVATINDDKLSEATDPDYEFRYLDIGAVGRGTLAEEPEVITFGASPSRARRRVAPGDTIVSTVRTYLRAVWAVTGATEGFVVSTGFAVVRPRAVEPQFLRWSLQSDQFIDAVVANSNGVSYPAINPSDLAALQIPVPPEAEQRRIADFLDAETSRIDALITAKQQILVALDEKADAIVGGAITASGLVHGGSEDHTTSIKRELRKLARHNSDDAPVMTAYRDGQVTARHLRRSEGYTESWTPDASKQGVCSGDVVIHGLDGFAGAIGTAEVDGCCSPAYHVCEPVTGDSDYLGRLLRLLAITGYLELFATSTRERAVDFRNWQRFREIPIPSTDLAVQRRVGDLIRSTRPLRSATLRQIDLLKERRQALITAVVSGEVTV